MGQLYMQDTPSTGQSNRVPPDPAIQPGTMGSSRGEDRRARHGNRKKTESQKEVKVDTEKFLKSIP